MHSFRCSIISIVICTILFTISILGLTIFDCGKLGNRSCFGTQLNEKMILKGTTYTSESCGTPPCDYACNFKDVWFFENKNYKCNVTQNSHYWVIDPFKKYKIGHEYRVYINKQENDTTCNFDPKTDSSFGSGLILMFFLCTTFVCMPFGICMSISLFLNKKKEVEKSERLPLLTS